MEGVASDHVAKMFLGIDWLEAQAAIWDMKRLELFLYGRVFVLKPKIDGGWVRRVVAQESVQFPARRKTNVTGCTVYRNLFGAWESWTRKPGSSMGEVRVARALLPNRYRDVPVRIMNLASYPVTLNAEIVLAELEPVQLIDDVEPETSETPQEAVPIELEDRDMPPNTRRNSSLDLIMRFPERRGTYWSTCC